MGCYPRLNNCTLLALKLQHFWHVNTHETVLAEKLEQAYLAQRHLNTLSITMRDNKEMNPMPAEHQEHVPQ
jgi:hypothetical protein